MVENQVNFKLRYMLNCSDEEFRQKVAEKVEGRRLYELSLMHGAHTSSQTADVSFRDGEVVDCFEPQANDAGKKDFDSENSESGSSGVN